MKKHRPARHAARAASQPPQQQPLPHPLRRIPPNPFPGSQAEDVHGLPHGHGEPRVLFSYLHYFKVSRKKENLIRATATATWPKF